MGMDARLSVSLSCSFAPLLITTYLFFSFSAAAADRRGPHFLFELMHYYFDIQTQTNAISHSVYTLDSDLRSAVGDVFLQRGQSNLSLDTLRLCPSAQVNVHHVPGQSLMKNTQA